MVVGRHATRREAVLAALADAHGPLSVTQVATRLGMHPNTARFHLDRLAAAGLLDKRTSEQRAPGRPACLYRLRRNDSEWRFRALAGMLVDSLTDAPDASVRATQAGRAWGGQEAAARSTTEPFDALVDLLDEFGFDPQVSQRKRRIEIRCCPFEELAARSPGVVCSIHRGIMEGALAAWRADLGVEDLDRPAAPGECTAYLTNAAHAS